MLVLAAGVREAVSRLGGGGGVLLCGGEGKPCRRHIGMSASPEHEHLLRCAGGTPVVLHLDSVGGTWWGGGGTLSRSKEKKISTFGSNIFFKVFFCTCLFYNAKVSTNYFDAQSL